MLYRMRYISHKSKAMIAQSPMTVGCGLHGLAQKNYELDNVSWETYS